jgi:hypothetical protein
VAKLSHEKIHRLRAGVALSLGIILFVTDAA